MSTTGEWARPLGEVLRRQDGLGVCLLGVGNPIKRDDSVGLYMADKTARALGSSRPSWVHIPRPSAHLELALSRLDLSAERLLIFDAVEAGEPPGSVVFASAADSRYGFFATHNVPLRIQPSLAWNLGRVYVLGVQPEDVEVGEGLSPTVKAAADGAVDGLVRMIRAAPS